MPGARSDREQGGCRFSVTLGARRDDDDDDDATRCNLCPTCVAPKYGDTVQGASS